MTAVGRTSPIFLVMEYVEGETLADRLAKGALPARPDVDDRDPDAGPGYIPKLVLAQSPEQIDSALWILESPDPNDPANTIEGTAFVLEGYGLVSCSHCIGSEPVVAYRPALITQPVPVTVTHRCTDRDLVRLQMGTSSVEGLRAGRGALVRKGDSTIVAGYGNYAPGASSRLIRGHITGTGVRHNVNVIYSDHRVFAGHSGGPALNEQLAVIGILQRGITNTDPLQAID